MSSVKIKIASAKQIRTAARSFPHSLQNFTRLKPWRYIEQPDKNKGLYRHTTPTGKDLVVEFTRSSWSGKVTWRASVADKALTIERCGFGEVYIAAQAINFLRTRGDSFNQRDLVAAFSGYYLETHSHVAERFKQLTIRSE